jgi:hypothetical protein
VTLSLSVGVPAFAAFAAPQADVVGLRRLTEREYRNSVADIFGPGIAVQGAFEPSIRVGGLMAASTTVLSITPAGFESFSKMADSIAIQAVEKKNRDKLIACKPKSADAPDDACASQVLSHYGRQLFRRPLRPDELKARVALAGKLARASKDFYAGLRYGLASLLQAPDFLFRKEIAVPVAGSRNYTLEPYSRASRLSYLLWDSTPDHELLRAAETGELATPAGVSKQVERLMASPRLETGMRAFFSDMLQLDTFDNVTKDSLIYPKWGPLMAASAREETLRTTIDLTLRENDDLRNLMTTRKTFLNRALSSIYGVPFRFESDWVPYEFPQESGRSGLLTEISMLAMFSHPGRSSPTKRGVAIMDIFLCAPTPLPPANVDFSIVNNTNGPMKTVRERLMAHASNPGCASCHTHSDPIGLTLEGFDGIGVFRTRENGELINLTGTLQGKSFTGADGVGKYLRDNPRFPACVSRKLYSYAKGVNSEDVAASAFREPHKKFAESGYRLRALIKALTEAPEFFDTPSPVKEASSGAAKVASKRE